MPSPLPIKRVRHRTEPERGVGIELARGRGSDRRVLVKWDDGTQQYHDRAEILSEGNTMRVTKMQLRRIIREEKAKILREQAGDEIEFSANFIWDDYNYSGDPGEELEQVFVSIDDVEEWGSDTAYGVAQDWAGMNLDGGMEVSDIEIAPEDVARIEAWLDSVWG